MAVYFEQQVDCGVVTAIHTGILWHPVHPLLAVGSYADDRGGFVTLFDEQGHKVEADYPSEPSAQITGLSWHPQRKLLALAWESGELILWNVQDNERFQSDIPHKAPVCILEWSSAGSRLTSADANGAVMCWKVDSRGHLQTVFHHDLKDSLMQVVFRTVSQLDNNVDIGGLARAAVSGDEKALDLFSSWHPKDKSVRLNLAMERRENLNFFIASASGIVYYINENGSSIDVLRLDVPIHQLLYHEDRDLLIVITDTLVLYQYQVNPDGTLAEVSKIKLIGKSLDILVTWAGKGILAVSTGENTVRMWDVDMGDNYILTLEGGQFHDTAEILTYLSYCPKKGILAGGTNRGNVAMWRYTGDPNSASRKDSEDNWKLQSPATVQGAVKHVRWGSSKSYLAVNTVRDIYILREQIMCAHFKDQVSAVQVSPTQLAVDLFSSKQQLTCRTDLQIRGVFVIVDHIAVWNGEKVAVYEISMDTGKLVVTGAFPANTLLVAMYEHNVYTVEAGKVHVRTYQGTIKQTLTFLESEGTPMCIDVCGTFLVVGTTEGILKVWDLSRREAKLHANPKPILDFLRDVSSLISAKCNCNGTKVSIIGNSKETHRVDSKLYIWDIETDTIQYFNFESGRAEQDDDASTKNTKEGDLSTAERARLETSHDIEGRYPVSHYWDPEEPRQLVCEAAPVRLAESDNKRQPFVTEKKPPIIVSLFVTPETGTLVQEATPLNDIWSKLLGVQVPHYYLLSKDVVASRLQLSLTKNSIFNHKNYNTDSSGRKKPDSLMEPTLYQKPSSPSADRIKTKQQSGHVHQQTMRDFAGLEESDKKTRQAMMNFSYYLTIGNMDEAFKAIKMIKSGSVWENMAKMCVKTKRLDVASVCLGNMGHARGARALREAMHEPELDARVGMLALHLGMLDEAEKLYTNCERYDLLNKFYQDCGRWSKALEIATKFDRIHLRTTYYNYAKHLEASGNISEAIPNFEKSDTHRFEVPRMLFDEPHSLEEYISRSKDKALHKWWAQYMESTGEMETALQCYELAQDYLSLVRVYCYCNNLEKAAEIANETGDKAACCHLGRQYENHDDIKEAVHFYTRAQAYSNAIRLCKEHGLEDQLLNLALMGNAQEMIDVARYYENRSEQQENAVMLYHKAGLCAKAVELAFQTNQYSILHQIANELNEKTDPHLLHRCAQFLMENGQYDRAVDLLAVAKKYVEALDLCVEHNIPITEDLAEKLTPAKDSADAELRMRILEKVADSCYQQENYHLATKKFTQAGNKIKAMKALLKSGDTDKITFFATVSRQKEIYIMAANYLQSLDWRRDPEIMKNIIGFYTKGRAVDLLAGFYDACAQVEIDEFQNYDKALGAINEAYKCWGKVANKTPTQEDRVAQLNAKLELVKKFVQARRAYEENPADAMKMCQNLLTDPNLEIGIRRGDVYGFMIEHYARQQNYKAAYNLMEEMRSRMANVNVAYYVNMKTVESIYSALDLPLNRNNFGKEIRHSNAAGDEELGEEVEEEVKHDIYNGGDTYAP